MTIHEFNDKYKDKKLVAKILTTEHEYKLFNSDPELYLDYRFSPTHLKNRIVCDKEKITTQTYLLYQNDIPVGLSTLVIEPRRSFEKTKGMKRRGENYKVIKFTELLDENTDFGIIRGWRVLKKHLRGQGIGLELRNLVTHQIEKMLKENPELNFAYWGKVAGILPEKQQEQITKYLNSKSIGDIVNLKDLEVEENLFGVSSEVSIPAFIGYVKDGYTYKQGYFFPKSYGPLFILENQQNILKS